MGQLLQQLIEGTDRQFPWDVLPESTGICGQTTPPLCRGYCMRFGNEADAIFDAGRWKPSGLRPVTDSSPSFPESDEERSGS